MRLVFAALAAMLGAQAAAAELPANYPADYKDLVAAAEKQGRVVIYSNTEQFAVAPVLAAFEKAFPTIKVDYTEIKSSELFTRFVSEAQAGALQADIMWSSSMDLQFKLLTEGYAQAYVSPEKGSIPGWANWKDQGFGITFEPAAFIYNKRLMSEAEAPKSHVELARLLGAKAAELKGKVATYDIQRSGLGYFLVSQDLKAGNAIWDIAKGMGQAKGRFYTATGSMLEKVSSGEHTLAFNVVGSYALLKAKTDPAIGVVIPQDYAIVMSRIAFIPKDAKRPAAAKVFMDFLLSRQGQDAVANQALLFSLRGDVDGVATAAKLTRELGQAMRPVAINDDLLELLDAQKRLPFFKKWQALVDPK